MTGQRKHAVPWNI